MNIKGMIAVGSVLLALIGCSNTPTTEVIQNKFNDVQYPPISVYYKNPSSALRNECNTFHHASAMKTCLMNHISVEPMVTLLEQSNYFAKDLVNAFLKDAEEQELFTGGYIPRACHILG